MAKTKQELIDEINTKKETTLREWIEKIDQAIEEKGGYLERGDISVSFPYARDFTHESNRVLIQRLREEYEKRGFELVAEVEPSHLWSSSENCYISVWVIRLR